MRPLLIAVLALAGMDSYALARRLTVEEAEQMAVSENPRLRAGMLRAEAAVEGAHSLRGRLLPSVRLFDEYQHWDSAFLFPNIFPSAPGSPPLKFPAVRDQDTNTFVVTVNQPLIGLAHLSQELEARNLDAEAAAAGTRAGQAALREGVRTGFLRYFEARALEDIARSSEKELGEQIGLAEARLKAGVLTNADVLRVKVAVANARQQEIQAHSMGLVARAQLLAAIGLDPDDTSVELVEPQSLLQSAGAPSPKYAEAHEAALAHRPEVEQLHLASESALRSRRARMLSLLPDVDLEAGYTRIDGQLIAPANSEYVGLKATWAVWEWGASYFAYRAADRQAEAAAADLEYTRSSVAAEVATDLAQSEASRGAVETAREAITSAEEAFRVMGALVKAGSATTTDLLDAQAALTQARLNLTRAQYEQAITTVALGRVLGR